MVGIRAKVGLLMIYPMVLPPTCTASRLLAEHIRGPFARDENEDTAVVAGTRNHRTMERLVERDLTYLD